MSTLLTLRVFFSDLPPQIWASREKLEDQTRGYLELRGLDFRSAMQMLRAAVTGSVESPSIFGVMEVLGRDDVLGRLDDAMPGDDWRKTRITGDESWLKSRPVFDQDALALLRRDAG